MNYLLVTKFLTFAFLAYLIGSIPFAYLAGIIFKKGDIRKKGTGNVGGGNAMMVIGPLVGLMVILLDVGKGAFAAYLGQLIFHHSFAVMVFGIMVIFGHCFSIFLKFKGGKGVATTIGVYAYINFPLALLMYFIWLLLSFVTKYTYVSTMLIASAFPVILLYKGANIYYIIFGFFVALMLLLNHREHVIRLLAGKEKTFKQELSERKKVGDVED